jgi:hypothetical protein
MDRSLLAQLGIISVITLQQINTETIQQIISNLNLLQFITLLVTGSVLIDWMKLEGWKDKIPFYLVKCPKHGYQLSYPSGFKKMLTCPKCIKDNYF